MKIGDEVYVHGYVDEIRKDCIIIRNGGGYFGTVENEVKRAEQTEPQTCDDCIWNVCNYNKAFEDEPQTDMAEDIVMSYGFKAESYRQAKAKTEQTDCPQSAICGKPCKECGACEKECGMWEMLKTEPQTDCGWK